uniref:Uncharacterized protein n=1 Tax=Cyanoderma ruficeps TaxID=181631 RepID=A0A8C3QGX8_9PASS
MFAHLQNRPGGSLYLLQKSRPSPEEEEEEEEEEEGAAAAGKLRGFLPPALLRFLRPGFAFSRLAAAPTRSGRFFWGCPVWIPGRFPAAASFGRSALRAPGRARPRGSVPEVTGLLQRVRPARNGTRGRREGPVLLLPRLQTPRNLGRLFQRFGFQPGLGRVQPRHLQRLLGGRGGGGGGGGGRGQLVQQRGGRQLLGVGEQLGLGAEHSVPAGGPAPLPTPPGRARRGAAGGAPPGQSAAPRAPTPLPPSAPLGPHPASPHRFGKFELGGDARGSVGVVRQARGLPFLLLLPPPPPPPRPLPPRAAPPGRSSWLERPGGASPAPAPSSEPSPELRGNRDPAAPGEPRPEHFDRLIRRSKLWCYAKGAEQRRNPSKTPPKNPRRNCRKGNAPCKTSPARNSFSLMGNFPCTPSLVVGEDGDLCPASSLGGKNSWALSKTHPLWRWHLG